MEAPVLDAPKKEADNVTPTGNNSVQKNNRPLDKGTKVHKDLTNQFNGPVVYKSDEESSEEETETNSSDNEETRDRSATNTSRDSGEPIADTHKYQFHDKSEETTLNTLDKKPEDYRNDHTKIADCTLVALQNTQKTMSELILRLSGSSDEFNTLKGQISNVIPRRNEDIFRLVERYALSLQENIALVNDLAKKLRPFAGEKGGKCTLQ